MSAPRLVPLLRPWLSVLGLCAAGTALLALLGVSTPVLFGTLVGGVVYGVVADRSLQLPAMGFNLGQGVIGATIGALVSLPTLRTLAGDWLPVLGVTVGTLVLSVGVGQLLRLHRGVTGATAAFAMVAGGASGIVAVARELGADDRVVTVVQYLRVLLVLLAMPAVTALVFRPDTGHGAGTPDTSVPWGVGAVFTALCVGLGLMAGRYAHVPAGALLGPLLVAVAISVTGILEPSGVPSGIQQVGYALIGVQVGLRFTRSSIAAIGRLLPLATGLILVVIAGAAGLGLLLSQATGVSPLSGYLATTPGGLYAVLAAAVNSGSDVTLVLAVQVIRVFATLLSAPLLSRLLRE